VLTCDLASQASIRDLAQRFLAIARPLHVLINNAGVVNLERKLTVDGIEEVFAVNHLGYFLLTSLLLERLERSAPARIVNVASEAHRFGIINFDDLGYERGYSWMKVYGQSKLANIHFTYELAERMKGRGVTVNCLHPGAVATGLAKNTGPGEHRLIVLLRPFFRPPQDGAETSIHVASSAAVEGVTGQYFRNCKPARSSHASHDRNISQRLWGVSEQMTKFA
jgi:NAD(P)-dependent dehydrogenase (short-subunit alcohol dehydrogenase family)